MDSYERLEQLLAEGTDFCTIEDILDREYPLETRKGTPCEH